jgi:outer membrane protein assembly factor BamB
MVALGIGLLTVAAIFQVAEARGQRRAALRKGGFGLQPYNPQPNPTLNVKPGQFIDDIAYDDKPEYKRYISAAQDCIRDQDWNKAAEALQKILDDKKDVTIEVTSKNASTNHESTRRVNVRHEANRLLGGMAKEGLETYQTLYGGVAGSELEKFKETGDLHLLGEVAKRYMHTDAGIEANELLATYYLDRGAFKSAAVIYERLMDLAKNRKKPVKFKDPELTLFKAALAFRRSGDQKNADSTWKTLEAKIRRTGLKIGDKKVTAEQLEGMFDAAESVVVVNLKDWPLWRGNTSRNAQADASAPLMDAKWKASTVHDQYVGDDEVKHADTEAWLKMAIEAQEKMNFPVLSGSHPVAANNKLIFRSYGAIVALYVKDGRDSINDKYQAGELAWKSPMDGALSSLLAESNYRAILNEWQNSYRQTGFNMVFENSMVGTLSTDGGKVYAIDDLAIAPHPQWQQQWMWRGGGPPSYPGKMKGLVDQNVLRAYDVESGKLLWQLPDRNDQHALADSHFLGAPLPIGGKLYVLNEKKNELRLLCLEQKLVDAAKGVWEVNVVQTQALCGVKTPITNDIVRRMHAVNLAYGEGMLVVPTNAGAVLGVDLLTQMVVWSCPYREGVIQTGPATDRWGRPVFNGRQLSNSGTEFKNSPPVIIDGKVVFAAPDGESIHCVDLREGTRQWYVKRADDLYLAGVFDGKVLMVGKTGCRALSLKDGRPVWALEAGTPTGQGVASKGIYYLPVKNKDKEGEVCAIDLAKGTIRAHNKSRLSAKTKEPVLPGNLLFHEGCMLSQSVDQVAAFPQLDVKIKEIDESLAKEPESPYWLTERGELRLADGKVKGAVTDLRKALALLVKSPARDVESKAKLKLYEAFTELFQNEFDVAADKYLDEYREVCKTDNVEETSRRQARFLYILGRGRENQGNLLDAYKAYMAFAALPSNRDKINNLDDSYLKTRADVWVRGRIAAMMANAAKSKREPLEEEIAKQWQGIESKNDLEAIRRFVNTFDVPFKVGRQARLRLADTLMERNDKSAFTEVEMVLLQLTGANLQEEDPETVARAYDALARLEIRKGTTESMREAAAFYRKLGREFARVVIRDGKTGADLFSDLATDKRFLPYLDSADVLRITGKMKAREVNPNELRGNNNNWFNLQNSFTFTPEGDVTPFFQRHRLVFSMNNRQLMLVDRDTGEQKWAEAPPNLTDARFYNYLYPNNTPNQSPHGRYNFYQVKGHLAAVQIGPMVYGLDLVNKKVLWEHSMLDQPPPVNVQWHVQPDVDGTLQIVTFDQFTGQPFTRKLGMLGNLEASYICIQTQKGLVALDPVKGTELWTKSDVPARTQIFGDDQHVYLVEVRGGTVVGGARCLRASDGARVDVPDFGALYQNRTRIIGRTLLVSETTKDALTVRLYDVHTGKDLWKKRFDPHALACRSEDPNYAGVIEPDGTATVVDLRTRKEATVAKLEAVDLKDLKEVLLFSDVDQFYLALNKPVEANVINGGVLYNNFSSGTRCATVNGLFYAFDRKGNMKWYAHVPHQMLVLEQFQNIPIVVFTARYMTMQNGGFQRWVVATRSIDKRTGKLVYDAKPKDYANGQQQWFTFNINVKKGTIDLVGNTDGLQHYLDDGRKVKNDRGYQQGRMDQPDRDIRIQRLPIERQQRRLIIDR